LETFERVFLIGAGKGSAPMAKAVEEIIGEQLTSGLVIVKYGHALPLKRVQIIEAAHPIPDEAGLEATQKILDDLQEYSGNDLVLCVFSGGGSALLPAPVASVTLSEKQETTRVLLECGASIDEINSIRKHLSKSKGGGIAAAAYPATVISLILSDVVGDALEVIASGPTVADSTTYRGCLDLIERYGLREKIPGSVLHHLQQGARGERNETPKPGDPVFDKVSNHIVGNNRAALLAAEERARSLGYTVMILSSCIQGEAREVAQVFAAIGKEIALSGHPVSPPACILAGGETTVTVSGSGKGGRCQEFALSAAISLEGCERIALLCGGTDGSDGPTDAAGAFADGSTYRRALQSGLNPKDFLMRNDAYTFFDSMGQLVKTGPTRTNVMDLYCLIVD
jgi:glycerate 2-kinase